MRYLLILFAFSPLFVAGQAIDLDAGTGGATDTTNLSYRHDTTATYLNNLPVATPAYVEEFPLSLADNDFFINNTCNYFKFVADQAITVSSITVYVTVAGVDPVNFGVALYDSTGTTRIARNASSVLATTGYNDVTLDASVTLSRGGVYWVGIGGDGSTTKFLSTTGESSTEFGYFTTSAAYPETSVSATGGASATRFWFMLKY